MADKLIIDWKEYNLIVEKLAIQIYQSGFKPDIINWNYERWRTYY